MAIAPGVIAAGSRLASAAGTSVSRGVTIARARGPDAANRIATGISNTNWRRAGIASAIGGGGLYASDRWASVRDAQARAIEAEAERAESSEDFAYRVLNDDSLSDDQKAELLDNMFGEDSPFTDDDDGSSDAGSDPDIFEQFASALTGDSLQSTFVRVAIAALIVYVAMQRVDALPNPGAVHPGGRAAGVMR